MKDKVLKLLISEFPDSRINETPDYTSLQTVNKTGRYQNYIEIHFNNYYTKMHIRSNELTRKDLTIFKKVPDSFGWVLNAEASIKTIEELESMLPMIKKSYLNVKGNKNTNEIKSIDDLVVGNIISNSHLSSLFSVANSGGMRKSNELNHLVLITDQTKDIYKDRWDEGILHYSGMGMKGNQQLEKSQNITLYNSDTNGITVYLFEVLKKYEYTYRGVVKLADSPYQETHADSEGKSRLVWVFPLKVNNPVLHYSDQKNQIEKLERKSRKKSNKDIELKNKNLINISPSKRIIYSSSYERDPDIVEYAKRRANGRCELCLNVLDFLDPEGRPFLETHHIKWLSEGGEDTIENTVALCPNCHKKMHVKKSRNDVKTLIDIEKFIIE